MRQQFRRDPRSPPTAFRDVMASFGRSSHAVGAAIYNRYRDDVENDGAYVEGVAGGSRQPRSEVDIRRKYHDSDSEEPLDYMTDPGDGEEVNLMEVDERNTMATVMQIRETTEIKRQLKIVQYRPTSRETNTPAPPSPSPLEESNIEVSDDTIPQGSSSADRQPCAEIVQAPAVSLQPQSAPTNENVHQRNSDNDLLPHATRTIRAMARQQHRERPADGQKIAKFLRCDRAAFYRAVVNCEGDDLGEDWAHVEGIIGELVNVDRLISEPPLSADYDRHNMECIDMKLDIVGDDDGILNGLSDAGATIMENEGNRPQSRRAASPDESDEEYLVAQLINAEEDSEDDTAEPVKIPPIVPSAATEPCRPTEANPATATLVECHGSQPQEHGSAVAIFLGGLMRPCTQLLPYFQQMGINSGENLDDICVMDGGWDEVKSYLLERGVTLYQWLIVRRGLRERASQLR
ncbi:hypothetical protein NM688_g719 [Phlebia brevispora]|uniref:Uncharacterized protein n=1 Tax=Phlebia brevispora TaxID=194682 RepID=A0ACC1TDW2_9APHY|nr:hypothetical protein NM688_g719 [Phlebia brevispora]